MNLRRTQLLAEAVKGGFQGDKHEIHATLRWRDEKGAWQHAPVTHGFDGEKKFSLHDGIKEYQDVIKNRKLMPRLAISVIDKPKPGVDPGRRFYGKGGTPTTFRSRISVKHFYDDAKKDGKLHFSTDLISTPEEHRRKGWASTIFDHAHRVLKKHDIHLTHDTVQLPHGKRWAARQETARGKGYVPIHRQAQSEPVRALALHTKIRDSYPEHTAHHTRMISLANQILDRVGGYHGRKEHMLFRRVSRRLGLPQLSARQSAEFMNTLGGHHARMPMRGGPDQPGGRLRGVSVSPYIGRKK